MTVTILSWLFVALFMGAACYFLDRHLGVPLYRWVYNMTHQHPLAAGEDRGFIYNRRAGVRFAAAVAISAVQSFLAASGRLDNPALQLLSFFLEVPVVMIGFYCGPWLDRFWRDKERIFEHVDRIESGQTTLSDELRGVSHRAAGAVREALGLEGNEAQGAVSPAPPQPEQAQETRPDRPPAEPRELMNRYLKRE